MTWDEHKLDMLERSPLWVWFVQKPFMVILDAVDKIMSGKVTEGIVEQDLKWAKGGKL